MEATEILKKIKGVKDGALFYTGSGFLVIGVYTDRFDRMLRENPQMLVGCYTRKAKLAYIEADMAWTLNPQGMEA